MKILKAILFIVLGLVAIVLITAAFVKKDFAVERSIIINRPEPQVFEYLKSLRNQNEWSTWSKLDPNMKTEFIGTDGTVGSISKWKGNKDVGAGEQEIKKIVEGERIETELRFKEPFESTNMAHFTTEAIDSNTTKVNWGFEGNMTYPMNIMNLFGMDEAVGKDFQQGLNNLKAKLEQ